MIEYSGLTAALATLFASLSIVAGSIQLPLSVAQATTLVAASAHADHVSGTEAHGAYTSAPYPEPALRYLYALGWIGANSNPTACKTALVFGPSPTEAATHALDGNAKLLARLRTARIGVGKAITALALGITNGCAS